jgi:hypothetical protein
LFHFYGTGWQFCKAFVTRHSTKRQNVIFLCTDYQLDIFCVIGSEKEFGGNLKSVSMEAKEILEELNRDYKVPEIKEEEKKVADKFNAVSEFEICLNCGVFIRYAI